MLCHKDALGTESLTGGIRLAIWKEEALGGEKMGSVRTQKRTWKGEA